MPEYQTDAIDKPDAVSADIARDSKMLIKAALSKISAKQVKINRYDRYYFGNHPLNFSSEKFTTEFAVRLQRFRDNLCPTCVQAPADRLEILGFASDKNSDLYKTTWDIWKYSQMPRFAKRVHRDAFRTGDAFVIVWADEAGRARLWQQDPATCAVFYDMETQTVQIGAKVWKAADKFVYLTLYFRDRIEKYQTRNPIGDGTMPTTDRAFVQRQIEGEDWPLPNELGINPMFHFGREASILDDVIPLNDALNKSICDMLISSEGNSLLKRWVTGVAYEINPETGKQIIPFENLATWFATKDPESKFGNFPEIDLEKFLKTVKDFRSEIAGVAGIPPYYFGQDAVNIPSGEALRKLESRFTSLIKDAQLDFGETWSKAMQFAVAVDNKQTTTDDGKGEQLEAKWRPADMLSETELVDLAIKKKNVGISTEKALSEIGYTDQEITEMQTSNQEAAARNASTFSKVFDAGPAIG